MLPPPPDRSAARPTGEGRRIAFRTAPLGFALALVSAPVAGWFAVWGLDAVNHCDDPTLGPGEDCGLGFAALIPLAWLFTVVVAATVIGLGFVRLPRWAAWTVGPVAALLIWGANLAAMSAYQPRR